MQTTSDVENSGSLLTRRLLFQRPFQYLGHVQRGAAGELFNLIAAAGAAGHEECARGHFADGREETLFADVAAHFEVTHSIAEVTCHSAAAAVDHLHGVAGGAERGHAGLVSDQRFLVAVTVEPGRSRVVAPDCREARSKTGFTVFAAVPVGLGSGCFAGDELVEGPARLRPQFARPRDRKPGPSIRHAG